MAERFEIEGRWPDLFEPLTDQQRWAVVQTFASAWHEGWFPNRTDVENLTQLTSGAITKDEYDRRARENAGKLRGRGDYTEAMRALVAEGER